MRYELVLRLTLIPSIFLFVLSWVSIILVTTYWIFSDWMIPRFFVEVSLNKTSESLIDYIMPATDATIVTAALGMMAAIVAFLGLSKLKKTDMDMEVNMPRRRFWIGFVGFTSLAVFVSAMATIILHYTEKGNDRFGCTSYVDGTGAKVYKCTREMGACNILPWWLEQAPDDKEVKRWAIPMTCNMIVATKWLQLIIMFTAFAIIAMFGWQSWIRNKTRYSRIAGKGGVYGSPTP